MRVTTRIAATAGLFLLGLFRGEAAMEVSGVGFAGGTGIERGVAQIQCRTNAVNVVRLSRGAVLAQNGRPKHDIILAAAHGFPESTDAILDECRVLGAHALPYRIANVWRSPKGDPGMADDWAVVLVDRRIEGDVGRLPLATVSGDTWVQLADTAAPVRVLLRQADPREGDCHLRHLSEPYEFLPTELLTYFCGPTPRAPGLSGSPLLIGVEGRPVVIGLHLGWGLQPSEDGRLRAVSLGRPIDREIAAAIAEAAEAARR